MDLKELQDLLKTEKGKVIIVENGEPLMVILPYQEYKKQNTLESRESINNESALPLAEEENQGAEELTIDDLPL